jgi:glycosyltransferase involved in cell wall biosynthesis
MSLALIIPAFNEAHRIDATLSAYRRQMPTDTRITVALDRSTDDTAAIVRRHSAVDPRVELLDFPRLGKGGSIMEAFRRCDADVVAFVDADGATAPRELLRLVDALQHADGVIASRRHPASVLPARRPLSRRLASAGFAFAVRKLFGLPYLDTQCGAKVLRREVVEQTVPLLSARDFLFDVDLLLVARALGFTVREVPTVWVDQDGSRLDAGADTVRMAVALLRLWLHHRSLPLDRTARVVREDRERAGTAADHAPAAAPVLDAPEGRHVAA